MANCSWFVVRTLDILRMCKQAHTARTPPRTSWTLYPNIISGGATVSLNAYKLLDRSSRIDSTSRTIKHNNSFVLSTPHNVHEVEFVVYRHYGSTRHSFDDEHCAGDCGFFFPSSTIVMLTSCAGAQETRSKGRIMSAGFFLKKSMTMFSVRIRNSLPLPGRGHLVVVAR